MTPMTLADVSALARAPKKISAEFTFPYLAHAPMEPLNCVIEYKPGESATIHSGSQMPTVDQAVAAIIANLQQSVEAQSAARSRIMDADFAQETANMSRAQILQQAGTAMVAQANQLPQGVLQLLKG